MVTRGTYEKEFDKYKKLSDLMISSKVMNNPELREKIRVERDKHIKKAQKLSKKTIGAEMHRQGLIR